MGSNASKTEESAKSVEPKVDSPDGDVPVIVEPSKDEKTKKPCKACSSCVETRKARDACMLEKGEDACKDLIEAHKQCLRDHGMKI